MSPEEKIKFEYKQRIIAMIENIIYDVVKTDCKVSRGSLNVTSCESAARAIYEAIDKLAYELEREHRQKFLVASQ